MPLRVVRAPARVWCRLLVAGWAWLALGGSVRAQGEAEAEADEVAVALAPIRGRAGRTLERALVRVLDALPGVSVRKGRAVRGAARLSRLSYTSRQGAASFAQRLSIAFSLVGDLRGAGRRYRFRLAVLDREGRERRHEALWLRTADRRVLAALVRRLRLPELAAAAGADREDDPDEATSDQSTAEEPTAEQPTAEHAVAPGPDDAPPEPDPFDAPDDAPPEPGPDDAPPDAAPPENPAGRGAGPRDAGPPPDEPPARGSRLATSLGPMDEAPPAARRELPAAASQGRMARSWLAAEAGFWLRNRHAQVVVDESVDVFRHRVPVYVALGAILAARPLAFLDEPTARGLFLRGTLAFAPVFEARDPSNTTYGGYMLEVDGEVGWLLEASRVDLGAMLGLSYAHYHLALNPLFPSAEYVRLSLRGLLHVAVIDEALGFTTELAFLRPLSAGGLADRFGADGFSGDGLDVRSGVTFTIPVASDVALRGRALLFYQRMSLSFAPPPSTTGSGASGTEEGLGLMLGFGTEFRP